MSSPTHEFTLILSGFSELTEDAMNALYEAGCDDGLLCLDKDGVPFIEFDRKALTLQEAISSAISDVEKTPYRVLRVETEEVKVVDRINSQLLAAS